jgi:hypothetical protein
MKRYKYTVKDNHGNIAHVTIEADNLFTDLLNDVLSSQLCRLFPKPYEITCNEVLNPWSNKGMKQYLESIEVRYRT